MVQCGYLKQVLIKLHVNKMNINQIAHRSYYCCCTHKLLLLLVDLLLSIRLFFIFTFLPFQMGLLFLYFLFPLKYSQDVYGSNKLIRKLYQYHHCKLFFCFFYGVFEWGFWGKGGWGFEYCLFVFLSFGGVVRILTTIDK